MTRLLVAAALLVTLTSCDSGVERIDLTGTWDVTSISYQSLGTVSQDQDALASDRPIEGSIALSGWIDGSVGFLGGYSYGPEILVIALTSYAPDNTGTLPPVRQRLEVETLRGETSVVLRTEDDVRGFNYFSARNVTQGLDRRGATLTLDLDLESAHDTDPVHVEGTVVLGHRTVTAGERAVLEDSTDPNPPGRYVFESGGVVRYDFGDSRNARTGTWQQSGDALSVHFGIGTREEVQKEYRLQRQGEAVLLVESYPEPSECTADCLRGFENQYGLLPGSLSAFHYETTIRLVPVATP